MGDLSENFSRWEFKCKCPYDCGKDAVDVELLNILNWVRMKFGPVKINSANRCKRWNAENQGSPKSQHLFSKAADIVVLSHEPEDVYKYLDTVFPDKYGFGLYKTFVHVDCRPTKARWGL